MVYLILKIIDKSLTICGNIKSLNIKKNTNNNINLAPTYKYNCYKELPKSSEEELRKLRTIWEMIKSENKK